MDITQLSLRFKRFAVNECHGSSDLYEFLSHKIANDEDLLELCLNAKAGQPVPNLFLSAVHFLLLNGKNHSLKEYYQSIVEHPQNPQKSFDHFKDFCRLYREDIISLISRKLVQTNEVRRCAYLYPSFCCIYEMVKKPLALIEIGTSAGLQLLWDQYKYSYGSDGIYGNNQSTVHIQSEIISKKKPLLFKNSPPVAFSRGIDLHISHLGDEEDFMWLKSLIWPEHHERRELFEKAAELLNRNDRSLIEGDGISLLTNIAEQAPDDAVICIFHTHVANQLEEEVKHTLINHIKRIGKTRDVFHLYNNMWDRNLHLDFMINGIETQQIIAEADGHGRWFKWLL